MNLYNLIDDLKKAASQTDVLGEEKPYIYFEDEENNLHIVDLMYIDEEGDIILKGDWA